MRTTRSPRFLADVEILVGRTGLQHPVVSVLGVGEAGADVYRAPEAERRPTMSGGITPPDFDVCRLLKPRQEFSVVIRHQKLAVHIRGRRYSRSSGCS